MNIAFFEVEDWEVAYFKEKLGEDAASAKFFPEKISPQNAAQAADAQGISIFTGSKMDAQTLQLFPGLKLIATRSTGFDHIDLQAAKERGIAVCNVPTYGENTVAEHAFGLMLSLARKIPQSVQVVKEKGFVATDGLRGFDLKGKTLGIVGMGHIGQHAARIANGFEMQILAFDVHQDQKLAEQLHLSYVTLEDLLKQSDIITLHVPDNPHTHHLINKNNIGLVKRGAYLINTSRGGIVETQALVDALEQGILAGAGLDVLEDECHVNEERELLSGNHYQDCNLKTMLENHVLMERENVIITPHNAFNSKEALERILEATAENIKGFEEGKLINTI